jgi:hypothetical protein
MHLRLADAINLQAILTRDRRLPSAILVEFQSWYDEESSWVFKYDGEEDEEEAEEEDVGFDDTFEEDVPDNNNNTNNWNNAAPKQSAAELLASL